jgi:hypothetical protein
MKNFFSENEERPEVDPAFQNQVPANCFNAPSTLTQPPAHPHVPLAPDLDKLAERTAPGSAVSADLTYTWRR